MDVESDIPGTPTQTTIRDHPFEPRGEWWSLCRHCGLGSASHAEVPPEYQPPWKPPKDTRRTDNPEPPEDDEPLPVGTGTEINMLDAQMLLEAKRQYVEAGGMDLPADDSDIVGQGRTVYEVYCIDWREPAGVETFTTEEAAREFAQHMDELALRCSVRAVRRTDA